MSELLTDTTVVASALAVAVVATAALALRSWGRRAPWWLWLAAALAAALVGGETVRYLDWPRRGVDPPTAALLALATAVLLAVVLRPAPVYRRPPAGRRPDPLGCTLAAATGGLFACVPETAALRALLLPVAAAAVASLVGLTRPAGRSAAAALALALAWVAVVDGQSRPESVVGAAAGLSGVGLRALGPVGHGGATATGRAWTDPAATAVAATVALVAARIVGLRPTVIGALVTMAAILVPTGGALVALRMAAAGPTGSVTDSTDRKEGTSDDG